MSVPREVSACSPDREMIAYTSGPNNLDDLFIIDLDGKTKRQHTDYNAFTGGPAWSPDGSAISCTSVHDNH
jgi:Tol biopolymer transport system component